MRSAPAIGFEYRPSRWLARLLGVVAALAMLAIASCDGAWWWQLPALAGVAVACGRQWRQWRACPWIAAGWLRDREWTLRRVDGRDVSARLGSFRVFGALVWLRLTIPGERTLALLLAPDNADADLRRRLRMRLACLREEVDAPPG